MEPRLHGVRVAVLVADGFEQVEVTFPVRALRMAGADVRILSLRPGRLRGMNLLWRGAKLPVDDLIYSARPEDYGAVYIPGGFMNPDLLRQTECARTFVQRFEALGRPIASMCHGPQLLISAGVVRGRQLASWPGIRDDVNNAGGKWQNTPVVTDRNWVTGRGPQDLPAFIPAMVELFQRQAIRTELAPARLRWVASASQVLSLGAFGYGVARALKALFRSRRSLLPGAVGVPLLLSVGHRVTRRLISSRERERAAADADVQTAPPRGATYHAPPRIEQNPVPSL